VEGEVPLLLLGRTTGETTRLGDVRTDDSEFFLQAPMPRGLSLHVRPSGALLGVLRSVSWVRHAVFGNPDLGDKEFEDEFSVSGAAGIPEALVVPRIRPCTSKKTASSLRGTSPTNKSPVTRGQYPVRPWRS
jgi:hypothetical protein